MGALAAYPPLSPRRVELQARTRGYEVHASKNTLTLTWIGSAGMFVYQFKVVCTETSRQILTTITNYVLQ